jgi:hypothetical protein
MNMEKKHFFLNLLKIELKKHKVFHVILEFNLLYLMITEDVLFIFFVKSFFLHPNFRRCPSFN